MRRKALKSGLSAASNTFIKSVFKNGAKETRTPDPLHAMQLVRSSEFACGSRKKPSIKGISEKLAFKPLWLARASYGGFALKIALSF